jgi:adenylate cyclase
MSTATRGSTLICRGCWDQMRAPIPIRGPLALPFRIFGITRSKMNPNICTICERSFRYVKKERHISAEASILFADIRGYTDLTERMDQAAVNAIVSTFQDRCAEAVWAHDGIVNKQMGDGLMAIFNFPIKIERHAAAAVAAAIDIQRHCKSALAAGGGSGRVGVGVGVHTGTVEIGEFSTFRSDFTAIGGPVNLAARLESQAAPGEIVMSPDIAAAVAGDIGQTTTRTVVLKGFDEPMTVHVLGAVH